MVSYIHLSSSYCRKTVYCIVRFKCSVLFLVSQLFLLSKHCIKHTRYLETVPENYILAVIFFAAQMYVHLAKRVNHSICIGL